MEFVNLLCATFECKENSIVLMGRQHSPHPSWEGSYTYLSYMPPSFLNPNSFSSNNFVVWYESELEFVSVNVT